MQKLLTGVIGLMILGIILGCSGKELFKLGIHDGRFAKCPDSPNCVSSQADPLDKEHYIKPFKYDGTKETAHARIEKILASQKRVSIIENRTDYIHTAFKSRLMGFVDDVEFYFPQESLIHVRSASRLGYSDLGVNRKRISQLRQLFDAHKDN